jgi:hypothetical protein
VRVNPPPVSMPVTVRRPVCAIRPVTKAAKVVKVGVVKTAPQERQHRQQRSGYGRVWKHRRVPLSRRRKHRRCFSAVPLCTARTAPHHSPERPRRRSTKTSKVESSYPRRKPLRSLCLRPLAHHRSTALLQPGFEGRGFCRCRARLGSRSAAASRSQRWRR